MKLPRWLVIAMLTTSMLSVLAAAGWWWVTWPERTAREFVELLRDGNGEAAERMVSEPPILWSRLREGSREFTGKSTEEISADLIADPLTWQLVPLDRTFADLLCGEQEFLVRSFGSVGVVSVARSQIQGKYLVAIGHGHVAKFLKIKLDGDRRRLADDRHRTFLKTPGQVGEKRP